MLVRTLILLFVLILTNGISCPSVLSIGNTKDDLKITSEIVGKTYCSNNMMKLQVHISLTNLGEIPLVIPKNYFAIGNSDISQDLESLNKNDFVSSIRNVLSIVDMSSKKLRPYDKKLFKVIKKGDSFSTQIDDFVDLTQLKQRSSGKNVYYIRELIHIWGGNPKYGERLQKEWLKENINLRIDPIFSEPMLFNIDENPKTENCN